MQQAGERHLLLVAARQRLRGWSGVRALTPRACIQCAACSRWSPSSSQPRVAHAEKFVIVMLSASDIVSASPSPLRSSLR